MLISGKRQSSDSNRQEAEDRYEKGAGIDVQDILSADQGDTQSADGRTDQHANVGGTLK
jgi:hypothetical protein